MKRSLWMLLMAFPVLLTAATPDDFSFAKTLSEQGDHYRAITFYKRYIYFNPSSPLLQEAFFRIGMSYQKGQQINLAIENFSAAMSINSNSDLAMRSKFEIGMTKYLWGVHTAAINDFNWFRKEYPKSELSQKALYCSGLAAINLMDWKQAAGFFNEFSVSFPKDALAIESASCAEDCQKAMQLPRKGPFVAGLLSALVPGLGQFYCDRYLDGLSSFLINGACLAVALISFTRADVPDVYGYIGGGLFAVFYISNIYGAVNSAQNGTQIIRINYRDRLLKKYGQPAALGVDYSVKM